MENIGSFQNLFSSFKPINRSSSSDSQKDGSRPDAKIELVSGEPFLTLEGIKGETSGLSRAARRLKDEIARLTSGGFFFDAVGEESDGQGVSLWEHPHLVSMLGPSLSVTAPDGSLIRYSEEQVSLVLSVSSDKESRQADMHLILRTEEADLPDPVFVDDATVLCGSTVYAVRPVGDNYSRIGSLLRRVDMEILPAFLTLFLSFTLNIEPELNGQPAKRSNHEEHAVPTLYLEKVAADKALYLRCGASLESLDTPLPGSFVPTRTVSVDDHDTIHIRKVEDCDMEERVDRLQRLILSASPDRKTAKEVYRDGMFFIVPEHTAGPFLLNSLPQILEEFKLVGSEKLREYKVVAAQPKLNLRLSSGIDFLAGEGDIEIGEETFTLSDFLSQYASKRYIRLSDGTRGIIDEGYINRLKRLFRRRDKEGKIRVTIFDLPEVEGLLEKKITGAFADRLRGVLDGFNGLAVQKAPAYNVRATLRPYQDEGVKWLRYLFDNRLGGCLADDMGLGKTLQTIALLSTLYPGSERPSMVVMPRSLLFNWEKELKRFAPQLGFSVYYGPDRDLEKALEADVVLTSYAVMRNDIEKLKEHKFECVVLDESQNIKNISSQTATAVMLLDTDHRLALSGTPMENNLTELYSLFRFLNPPMFGRFEDFNASYTYPIQKNGDRDATESLRRKIFPFILRRLKKDVLDDLPPRIDSVIYVEMSESQKRLYEERRLSFKQQIDASIRSHGVAKSQFLLFQALSELRRIASVPESLSDGSVKSPKLDELVGSLMTSVENGHKSVVFFNFIAGLELVAARLEKAGIQYESMTGSTSAKGRKKAVERFQTDGDCKVMLMTLKVGGVGLNLTAADTVYVFEPWWNKAAEEQGVNRLHRIGQKKTVNAFSMITVGTIEERIQRLQEQKSDLINDLISEDGTGSKQLSEKDIEFILS